ncbi:hypothetical protein HK100_006424 [Physocladia obscura]|uniref:Uncharacterized protein n=1 Tax=Physocladia obscura TaxID=109957 RepID=A0AAD5SQG3_9FUNG|nr:hypothetical protein HK100_006424 [Physocladia obscura]
MSTETEPRVGYEQIGPAFVAKGEANKYAILLGWLDGKFQYLEKYAQQYRQRNYTVIVFPSISADQSAMENAKVGDALRFDQLRPLVSYLNEHNITEPLQSSENPNLPSLVIHNFSNGGCFVLRRLVLALEAESRRFIRSAVILDSCPSHATPTAGAGFFSASYKQPIIKSIVWTIAYAGLYLYSSIFDMNLNPINVCGKYGILDSCGVRGPRLFLYSDTDELVPMAEVESRIKEAEMDGVVVVSKKFSGSEHVKHAVMFPNEYWAAVDTFLSSSQ